MNIDLPTVVPPEGMRLMHVVLFWFDEDNLNWKTEMQSVATEPVSAQDQAQSLRGLADTIELESEFREVIDTTCAECGHDWTDHSETGCLVERSPGIGSAWAYDFCPCTVPRP